MDMAVSNLFKHKMRLDLIVERTNPSAPRRFERRLYYRFQIIENVESISLRDVNNLYKIFYKPFILYALSKVLHKDRVIPINEFTITVGVSDLEEGERYDLNCYSYNHIWDYPEFFSMHRDVDYCPYLDHLVHGNFYLWINVSSYYDFTNRREEARFRSEFNYDRYWQYPLSIEQYLNTSDDDLPFEEAYDSEYTDEEEEYTPPTETYRQDHCVICLESTPNILYLNCMHIAICDSCDRLKETGRHKCNVCRREIFERVKI